MNLLSHPLAGTLSCGACGVRGSDLHAYVSSGSIERRRIASVDYDNSIFICRASIRFSVQKQVFNLGFHDLARSSNCGCTCLARKNNRSIAHPKSCGQLFKRQRNQEDHGFHGLQMAHDRLFTMAH